MNQNTSDFPRNRPGVPASASVGAAKPADQSAVANVNAQVQVGDAEGDDDAPIELEGAFKVLSEEELSQLSKSARRRYAKDLAFYESKAKRLEKRALERQRIKEKRKERREAGLPPRPVKRFNKDRVPTGVRVIIDMDFPGHMMQLKDAKSLCKQISFCYSNNRKNDVSVDLMATGMSSAMEDILKSQFPTFRNWEDVRYMDMLAPESNAATSSTTVPLSDSTESNLPPPPSIPKSSLVYLTGDSPNVLTSFEPGKTYIIGGLVDHNKFKKLCLNRAEEQGIAHAQLPIGEHIKLVSRRVLAVNHCFEIIIKVLENGGDWGKALAEVMPERKVKERTKGRGRGAKRSGEDGQQDAQGGEGEDDDEQEDDEQQGQGGVKRQRSSSPEASGDVERANGGGSEDERPAEKRAKK
ncbi:guanine-1-methyltransferase-domain-containing protein [Catenaria anguillulae PL171]|uniref:tRNA (guanine(9)-N1)-methyltransferase n=1 Tax=Catenaria anguillulae PL171 TaxID=765915 RepID=A0A1Y2HIH8_9FUNG|nr:guanine-1-methyltransferase-domain-containing protein [Catenaria anguillulae PL171]